MQKGRRNQSHCRVEQLTACGDAFFFGGWGGLSWVGRARLIAAQRVRANRSGFSIAELYFFIARILLLKVPASDANS